MWYRDAFIYVYMYVPWCGVVVVMMTINMYTYPTRPTRKKKRERSCEKEGMEGVRYNEHILKSVTRNVPRNGE
jgi:hypothetical protein